MEGVDDEDGSFNFDAYGYLWLFQAIDLIKLLSFRNIEVLIFAYLVKLLMEEKLVACNVYMKANSNRCNLIGIQLENLDVLVCFTKAQTYSTIYNYA